MVLGTENHWILLMDSPVVLLLREEDVVMETRMAKTNQDRETNCCLSLTSYFRLRYCILLIHCGIITPRGGANPMCPKRMERWPFVCVWCRKLLILALQKEAGGNRFPNSHYLFTTFTTFSTLNSIVIHLLDSLILCDIFLSSIWLPFFFVFLFSYLPLFSSLIVPFQFLCLIVFPFFALYFRISHIITGCRRHRSDG